MKLKYFLALPIMLLFGASADAITLGICSAATSCYAGYYLSGGVCVECPNKLNLGATSADKNISITGCYLPSGKTRYDSSGAYITTGACYYVN